MKQVLSFIMIFACSIALLLLNTGCDKEITSTAYSIDESNAATLIIYASANLDDSQIGKEAVPNGTKVLVSVSKNDFVEGNESSLNYTHELQDGYIEIDIPVTDHGVDYTITPMEFNYNQIQNFNNYYQSIPKIYSTLQIYNVNGLRTGEVRSIQCEYFPQNYDDFTEMMTLSGYITGGFNDINYWQDTLHSAQTFIFFGNGWNETVTTQSNGYYSIDVPINQDIFLNYDFTAYKIVLDVNFDPIQVLYRYNNEQLYVGIFNSSTSYDIPIGGGVPAQ